MGGASDGAFDVSTETWTGVLYADCDPAKNYTFSVTEHNNVRLVSVVVFEDSMLPDTANGYLPPGWSMTPRRCSPGPSTATSRPVHGPRPRR